MNKSRLSFLRPSSSLKTATYAIMPAVTAALLMLNPSTGFAEESCAELVTNRCEACHYSTRVCQKVQKKKGKSSWKRTVRNMVKNGAKLNKAEQKKLVACLSKPAPEILEFCGPQK